MFVLVSMIFLACTYDVDRGNLYGSTLLAIGDSVIEWNIGHGSVPENIGKIMGVSVYNAAISGSMMTTGEDWSIPNQFIEQDWEWVIMDGGANDLNELCSCGPCESVQMNLANETARLVERIRETGSNVVIWGYYGISSEAEEFGNCNESIEQLSEMQRLLAVETDGVIWVNGKEEIDGTDLSYYDDDLIHPSLKGGEAIAQQIVNAIQSYE